jgi:hypothetical protein
MAGSCGDSVNLASQEGTDSAQNSTQFHLDHTHYSCESNRMHFHIHHFNQLSFHFNSNQSMDQDLPG